jgi:hypothetical protein
VLPERYFPQSQKRTAQPIDVEAKTLPRIIAANLPKGNEN